VGWVEQLSGSGLAPRAGASAREGRLSNVCFIICAAKRHQVFLQAGGEERDDIAVLRRDGLVWIYRSSPPLAIERDNPIACLALKQGKTSILGIESR
jgi:hypothetical protein